jgi:predicted dehydrogenase
MPDDISVAIIGAGRHGRDLINYCLDIPGVRFKAVCDIWPYAQKYASGILKKRGQPVGVYEDYRELLAREKDLQAAIIATPDSFHADQAVACLEAGLHVYLEKEMAITIEAARRVVQTAKKTGKLLQVGRQHRSNPRYHVAYDFIHEKRAIGRIGHVSGQWAGHKRVPYKWPESVTIPTETLRRYGFESMDEHRNWRWLEKFSAGELVNLGAHQIDVLNWFLGATPKSVIASGGLDYYNFYQLYDNAHCLFEWDVPWEGASKVVRGDYHVNTASDNGGFFELFLGNEGFLEISEDPAKGSLCRNNEAQLQAWEPRPSAEKTPPVKPPPKPVEEDLTKDDLNEVILEVRPPSWEWMNKFRIYPPIHSPGEEKAPHWHHLANFFNAVRGTAKLTCPAEVGFVTAVSALKAVEAMKLGRRLDLKPEDFQVT